jgi:hypothetical protein
MGRRPLPVPWPGEPAPWEPARLPPDGSGPVPRATEPGMRPPWGRSPGPLTTAPAPDGVPVLQTPSGGATPRAPRGMPDGLASVSDMRNAPSGPMYVWDPATNSGPFPPVSDDNPT